MTTALQITTAGARPAPASTDAVVNPRMSRFNVDLIELLRPEDTYWPHPYTIEQAFEVFRKMVATGSSYTTPGRWGDVGVKALLSATSANDDTYVTPITSLPDLRKRIHYALLGRARSAAMIQWRIDHRMTPEARIQVRAPVHQPFESTSELGWESEAAIRHTLDGMLTKVRGQVLKVPLNYVHLGMRTVQGVCIHVSAKGFLFSLEYGDICEDGRDGSRWRSTLAHSRPDETFLDTLARARDVLTVILTGQHRPCDAAEFLHDLGHKPDWHRAHIAGYLAGDRTVCRPPKEWVEKGWVSGYPEPGEKGETA
jgi:hypothetical protein